MKKLVRTLSALFAAVAINGHAAPTVVSDFGLEKKCAQKGDVTSCSAYGTRYSFVRTQSGDVTTTVYLDGRKKADGEQTLLYTNGIREDDLKTGEVCISLAGGYVAVDKNNKEISRTPPNKDSRKSCDVNRLPKIEFPDFF